MYSRAVHCGLCWQSLNQSLPFVQVLSRLRMTCSGDPQNAESALLAKSPKTGTAASKWGKHFSSDREVIFGVVETPPKTPPKKRDLWYGHSNQFKIRTQYPSTSKMTQLDRLAWQTHITKNEAVMKYKDCSKKQVENRRSANDPCFDSRDLLIEQIEHRRHPQNIHLVWTSCNLVKNECVCC
jgi:hypothetical protein